MNSPVELIKERLSIVDLVSSYIKLEKAGANFKARCPFHLEKTASFFVSPSRGSFHCFGCNRGGDIFSFTEEIEGLNFPETLKILADRAGVNLSQFSGNEQGENAALYRILDEATKFFEVKLVENKEAVNYLRGRGLDVETIKDFRIGFAPDGWRNLSNYLESKKFSKSMIEKAGLNIAGKEGFYDRFRSRIMFPITNSQGKVVGFTGRIFPASAEGGPSVGGKYINSPETVLYNKSKILYGYDKAKREMMQKDFCVIVEGQMDLITAHQSGTKNAVAVSGTALTEDHLELVRRFTETIILAFDADSAGLKASDRAVKMALNKGFDVKIAKIPKGMDPADFILKDPAGWAKAIGEAKPIVDFYLAVFAESDLPERARIKEVREKILPYVAEIGNRMDQAHFIKRIAGFVNLSEESVQGEVQKIGRKIEPANFTKEETAAGSMATQITAKILGLILWQSEKKESKIDVSAARERFERIMGTTFKNASEKKTLNEKNDLIFETEMYYLNNEKLPEVADELFNHLEKEFLEDRLKTLMQELRIVEATNNDKMVEQILKQCQDISIRINEIKSNK